MVVTRAPRIIAFGLRRLDGVDGGIETHSRELYPRLASLGYDVTVLIRPHHGAAPTSRAAACKTKTIWAPRRPELETPVHSLLCTVYCLWSRPDVVHVHAIGPAICTALLKLARLRVVVTHHGCDYDAEKWNALLRGLLRLGEHIGVRFADAVICVSDTLRRDVESRFGVQARTIYNGAQIKPKIRPAARQLQALRANSYVLMVGRITKHKRVLDVIEAMDCPRLRDTPLVVCGSLDRADPNVTAVLAAAKNRPNVLLAGFVAPEHLPWLYARALCTVMASSYEGMPLAVLEALAAGSSVLLSDIPAHRELSLPPEQYVAVGNVSAIRTRLVRLWDERRRTPLRGRRPAVDPRFEWATIAQQTAAVFDAVARRLRRDGHAQRAPSPASSGGPSRSSGTLADSSGP